MVDERDLKIKILEQNLATATEALDFIASYDELDLLKKKRLKFSYEKFSKQALEKIKGE